MPSAGFLSLGWLAAVARRWGAAVSVRPPTLHTMTGGLELDPLFWTPNLGDDSSESSPLCLLQNRRSSGVVLWVWLLRATLLGRPQGTWELASRVCVP